MLDSHGQVGERVGNQGGVWGMVRPRRALLVDDSDHVRTVLRGMLEEDRVQVVEAKDGVEGLALLRNDPDIGLVFLDMNMPGMGGLELLRLIRAEARFATLAVVVLTGSFTDVSSTKDLGAAGWLQKPVRCEALLKVAQNFLGPQSDSAAQ